MSAISLYARATEGFDARVANAVEVLKRVAVAHPGRIMQVTSLGAEGMVVTDMIARHGLPIAIGTLDTGMLHAETTALIRTIETHYDLDVQVFEPIHESVIRFVRKYGDRAMYQSTELRKTCCDLRKVEPLARMLKDQDAWVTGMRREQSNHRGNVEFSTRDAQGRAKYNALADWSWADIWHYIDLHHVPYNPLHDQFFPSIGCAPCTRAVAVGEDFRAGRWWWEDDRAKECGLHGHAREEAPVSVLGSVT